MDMRSQPQGATTAPYAKLLGIGVLAFVLGVGAMVGVMMFQTQQQQIDDLLAVVEDLQSAPPPPQPAIVSRNDTADIVAVGAITQSSAPVAKAEPTAAERLAEISAITGIPLDEDDICVFK